MELDNKRLITERLASSPDSLDERVRRELGQLVTTSETAHLLFINDSEQFVSALEALNMDKVSSDRVVGWRFFATADTDSAFEHCKQPNIEPFEEMSTSRLLASIGDTNMNGEFPNNFKVHLLLKIDDESMLEIVEELDAEAVHCTECKNDEEVELSPRYGCGHLMDELYTSHELHVVPTLSDWDTDEFLTFG